MSNKWLVWICLIVTWLFFVTLTLIGQEPTPLETLTALRRLYPTPMAPAQRGALLNRAAWLHKHEGFGLLAKSSGNNCPSPTGALVACDILMKSTGEHYDVLIDSEGAARPVWREAGLVDRARFVAPVDPLGPLPERNAPEPIDFTPVLIRIERAEAACIQTAAQGATLLAKHVAYLADRLERLEAGISRLEATPFPIYRGRLVGWPVVLRPEKDR